MGTAPTRSHNGWVPPDSGPADNWQGSGLVLVVDDEAPVLRFASGMLVMLGFDVVAAADGLRALEVFQCHRDQLALVLLDLTIPGMDAYSLLSVLARERPDIPVVLSSGYDAADRDVRLANRPVAGFLAKPYRLEEMRAVLHSALDGH
jgi:two-component system cell cycle sensor histidine kinase/response regulator CckA